MLDLAVAWAMTVTSSCKQNSGQPATPVEIHESSETSALGGTTFRETPMATSYLELGFEVFCEQQGHGEHAEKWVFYPQSAGHIASAPTLNTLLTES